MSDFDFDSQINSDLSGEETVALLRHAAKLNSSELRINGGRISTLSAEERQAQRHGFYKVAGIPEHFWDMTMQMWRPKQNARGDVDLNVMEANQKAFAGEVVNRYIKLLPVFACGGMAHYRRGHSKHKTAFNSLVISGGQNSGKSFLAAMVCKAAVERGMDARYYDYDDIKIYCRDDGSMRDMYDEFKGADFVVVDNIYPAKDSYGWQESNMRAMARSRLGRCLPYIATMATRRPDERMPNEHPFFDMIDNDTAMQLMLPVARGDF